MTSIGPRLVAVAAAVKPTLRRPSVCEPVHYVSHGSPVRADGSQAYKSACRAAIITEVPEFLPASAEPPAAGRTVTDGPVIASLCVLNPTGQFFNQGVPCDQGDTLAAGPTPLCDGLYHAGGTWHWAGQA